MSAQHTQGRLKELAELAMPTLPWEKSEHEVPYAYRMAFKNAISPAAYLELLSQRDELLAALERCIENMDAVARGWHAETSGTGEKYAEDEDITHTRSIIAKLKGNAA